jgi:hypothetical protein
MTLKRRLLILTILMFLGTACAPKKQQLHIDTPPMDFKEKVDDADVQGQGLYSTDFDQSVTVKNQSETALVYRLSENMMEIGRSEQNPDLQESGRELLQKLIKAPGLAGSLDITQSPYVELAITETRDEVKQALGQVDTELQKDMTLLNQLLQEMGKSYPWPSQTLPVDQAGKVISGFLGEFAQKANDLDLFAALKTQLQAEITDQQKWIIDITTQVQQELSTVKHFSDLMDYIQKFLVAQQITPPDDLKKTLDQGALLSQDLRACHSDRAVLTAIVDVWTILDDQQRVKYIKPESEALYAQLKKSSDKDLQCLKTTDCMNPIKGLVKQIILWKISNMGVDKLCASIDQSALGYVLSTVETEVPQLYAQLPGYVSTALAKAIADKTKVMNDIRDDYAGFLKQQVKTWSAAHLLNQGKVRGFDSGGLTLSMKNKELQWQVVPGPATSENTGASMSALTTAFADPTMDPKLVQQSSLNLINQLVALGGYTTEYGTLTPALLTPLSPSAPILDLNKLTTLPDIYALPDQFATASNWQPREIHPKQFSLSARSQAELIRGLSHVIRYLSDWRTSAYDTTLGNITAATLVPDYKDVAELQSAMFPKADLMTLAIGDLAVTLENLSKKMSQAFLVGLNDNKITFVNDYDLQNGETVAMGGVVDIKNGQRAQVVRSQDLSRWILALSDFISSVEGIEKTKADILLGKSPDGKTSVDALVSARHQLKLLMVSFANLLSHQMVGKDGLVMSQLKLTDLGTETGQKTLLDQALAIQALMRASQVTGIRIYRVSAHEIYFRLNHKKYLPKMHFYSMSGQVEKVDLETLSEMLRAMSDLKSSLPEKSQRQAEWIMQPWLAGLSQLH